MLGEELSTDMVGFIVLILLHIYQSVLRTYTGQDHSGMF